MPTNCLTVTSHSLHRNALKTAPESATSTVRSTAAGLSPEELALGESLAPVNLARAITLAEMVGDNYRGRLSTVVVANNVSALQRCWPVATGNLKSLFPRAAAKGAGLSRRFQTVDEDQAIAGDTVTQPHFIAARQCADKQKGVLNRNL
jgi:hypothetical protein